MYDLRRRDRVQAWFDAHADDPDACEAMARWLIAAITGPKLFANGAMERPGRGHRLYYSVVPGTNSIVCYSAGEVPVRVMTIVSIIPAP